MTLPQNRPWLIYDQRCGLCRSLVQWLETKGLLEKAVAVSIFDAAAELPLDILDQTVYTALLYDPRTRTATGRIDALLQLLTLHQQAIWLTRALAIPPVSLLARWAYGFVSQHRRTLSPVPTEQQCAVCDPPETTKSFLTFVGCCFLAWLIATLLWGAVWGMAQGMDPWAGAGTAVLVTGFGWLLALGQLPFLHRVGLERRWSEVRELAKQLALMLAASAAPFPAAALLSALMLTAGLGHSPVVGGLNLLALIASATAVLMVWRHRIKTMRYPVLYPLLWLVAWVSGLLATALVVNSFN